MGAVKAEAALARPARRLSLARLLEDRNVLGVAMVSPAVLLLLVLLAYPFFLGSTSA